MKQFLLFTFLFVVFFQPKAQKAFLPNSDNAHLKSSWSKEMFAKYDWQKFFGYKPANEQIDLKNIDYSLLNAAVFYTTNFYRERNNLPSLKHHDVLESAADMHANDMVKHDFFSHESPLEGKTDFTERIQLSGELRYSLASENIVQNFVFDYASGRGYSGSYKGDVPDFKYSNGEKIKMHSYLSLAKTLLAQWMRSPGHRANILNRQVTHLGCGTAVKKRDTDTSFEEAYAVQVFAKVL